MKNWTLTIVRNSRTILPSAQMIFDSPYNAAEWLRQLGYTYQEVGAETKRTGTAGEPALEIYHNGNLPIVTYTLTEQA
jgi:hypothetical protein